MGIRVSCFERSIMKKHAWSSLPLGCVVCLLVGPSLQVEGAPDLVAKDFAWINGEPVAEQSVTVRWVVANEVVSTANPSWWDRVYFSTNELWDASDRILSDVYLNQALAVGASYTNTRTVNLPSVAA